MTREEARKSLEKHLIQCGAFMPAWWIKDNGNGSEFMEAFQMALDALREQDALEKMKARGQVVYYPCGVGDVVYEVKRCTVKESLAAGVKPDLIRGYRPYGRDRIYPENRPWKIEKREMKKSLFNQIGKTIFVTLGDAEAALNKQKGNVVSKT